jgi:hypothetical protein
MPTFAGRRCCVVSATNSHGENILTESRILNIHYINKGFWEKLIAYFPFIRHGLHRKRRIKQFFYCCSCIRCSGRYLPSRCIETTGEIHIQTQTQQGDLISLLLFSQNTEIRLKRTRPKIQTHPRLFRLITLNK